MCRIETCTALYIQYVKTYYIVIAVGWLRGPSWFKTCTYLEVSLTPDCYASGCITFWHVRQPRSSYFDSLQAAALKATSSANWNWMITLVSLSLSTNRGYHSINKLAHFFYEAADQASSMTSVSLVHNDGCSCDTSRCTLYVHHYVCVWHYVFCPIN